jgi:hypothetical protein
MTALPILGSERVGRAPRPIDVAQVDAKSLEAELRGKLRGEVRFDDGSRAL